MLFFGKLPRVPRSRFDQIRSKQGPENPRGLREHLAGLRNIRLVNGDHGWVNSGKNRLRCGCRLNPREWEK
jgi:hypothetical protein